LPFERPARHFQALKAEFSLMAIHAGFMVDELALVLVSTADRHWAMFDTPTSALLCARSLTSSTLV
jgi:hypothetical protein